MALQSAIVIEVEKNGKTYVFHMPYGVPLQDCYDASIEVTKEIVEFSKKMEEQKTEQEAAKEEVAEEAVEVKEDGSAES